MAVAEANRALLESWELALHRRRPRTVSLYLAELERFVQWLVDCDRPADSPGDLAAVNKCDVESWIADLRKQGRAGNTIRNRWVALRSFYRWALEEEEITESPLARVVVDRPDTQAPSSARGNWTASGGLSPRPSSKRARSSAGPTSCSQWSGSAPSGTG